MRPKALKETLKSLYKIRRTVVIEGPPGGGKTTIVKEVARELGIPCTEVHLPTMLVEDFGILFPDKDSDKLTYKLPYWFPVEGQAPPDGILLFDDRNQASPELQKVLANICQARSLHGYKLPNGWQVVSTGNRQKDRAGANRILSHLRNRETVIELETHVDDWTSWALDHNVKPEVIAFIRFRPDLLHSFDPSFDVNATPRSWVEGVSTVLGVVPPDVEFECFKGAVGEGPAAEFVGFLRVYRELPDINNIIKNPLNAQIPQDYITLYALVTSLVYYTDTDNFASICSYINRLNPEFSVLYMSLVIKKNPSLTTTQTFAQWAIKNQNVLF